MEQKSFKLEENFWEVLDLASDTKSALERVMKADKQKEILAAINELKEEIADLKEKFNFLYNANNSNARRILELEEKPNHG